MDARTLTLLIGLAATILAVLAWVRSRRTLGRRKRPSGSGFAWALLFLSSGRMPPPPPQSQIEQETGERKNRETGRSNDT